MTRTGAPVIWRQLLSLADQRDQSYPLADVIAQQHLIEVDRKLVDLSALRRELDSLIDQCGCGTIADCRIIEALSRAQTAFRG